MERIFKKDDEVRISDEVMFVEEVNGDTVILEFYYRPELGKVTLSQNALSFFISLQK